MNRVTAHLELNPTEVEWLARFAAAHEVSIDAAARHAVRLLRLVEETPGAGALVQALRSPLREGNAATLRQVFEGEQATERARRDGLVSLLDKLMGGPDHMDEIGELRRIVADLLFPEGGADHARVVGEEPSALIGASKGTRELSNEAGRRFAASAGAISGLDTALDP